MNVRYEARFERDLRNIRNKNLLQRMKNVIDEVKKAENAHQISKLKKL